PQDCFAEFILGRAKRRPVGSQCQQQGCYCEERSDEAISVRIVQFERNPPQIVEAASAERSAGSRTSRPSRSATADRDRSKPDHGSWPRPAPAPCAPLPPDRPAPVLFLRAHRFPPG